MSLQAKQSPLSGIKVIDFSTFLPGPLATLMLAEAGATVTKVERPPHGDPMKSIEPVKGERFIQYTMLNRGKKIVYADLNNDEDRQQILNLVGEADVLVEQFRPGVMERLGFGFQDMKRINPSIVYCSITGFGQNGKNAAVAGHDLNYMAEAGLLSLTVDDNGRPHLLPILAADIGGGAYPAFMNILLALLARDNGGDGCHIDVSMTDNLFPLAGWALAHVFAGDSIRPGGEQLTGGSPRYRIYETKDHRFLAVAAIEDRFWLRLCELVGLDETHRHADAEPDTVMAALSDLIRAKDAATWQSLLAGEDVCCNVVRTIDEAADCPVFKDRGVFDHQVTDNAGLRIGALPMPIDARLRRPPDEAHAR